ncbi:unnamed protein product [Penicillium olsonii]|nr:unnamed protein product [Penicillium olsonii]CAG7931153.1 unnamed protein product [Penicillium olsonii]
MAEKSNVRGNPKAQSSSPAPTPTPSLANRIQSSATGLAKSTFKPGSDLNNTLSSTNSKSGPSAQSSNAGTSIDSLSGPTSSVGPKQESFRSSNSAIPDEEFDFQHAPQLDEEDALHDTKGKGRLDSWNTNYASSQSQSQSQFQPHPQNQNQNHNHNQNPEDGAAVVDLLSAPSTEEDPATIPETDLDPAPLPLSASEREALDSFRLSSHGPRLTSASLVPDIDTFLSQGYNESQGQGQGQALRDEVLARLPGAGDWVGVQERYHEEVWGFLGPVLEAARTEIEQGKSEEGPAVRRLKMILGHMGG